MNENTPTEEDMNETQPAEEAAEEPIMGDAVDTPDAEDPEARDPDPRDAEIENLNDQMLRLRAEFDNYRKRTLREQERMRTLAAESIVRDLLPVLDNLELALSYSNSEAESLTQGVELVGRQFHDVLAKHGVAPIDAVGQPFDPAVHEAVSQMPSEDHPEDHIAIEYQKGYRLGEQVLRPSKVVVSVGAPDGTAGNESDDTAAG